MDKPTVSDKLDQILGLAAAPRDTDIVPVQPAEVVTTGNKDADMDTDLDFVRKSLYHLIETGQELSDRAVYFAKEKQEARAIEAASSAQKETREHVMALIELHRVRKEIDRMSAPPPSAGGDTTINQTAVFYGTTGEMLKLLKDMPQLPTTIDVTESIPEKPKK